MPRVLEQLAVLEGSLDFRTVYSLICRNGETVMGEFVSDGGIHGISYSGFDAAVKLAALRLQRLLGRSHKGGYIGLKSDNTPEWPVLFWAILMSGHKPLLLDFRLNEAQTSHLTDEAGAVAVISNEKSKVNPGYLQFTPGDILEGPIDSVDCIKAAHPGDGMEESWEDEIALCTSGTTSTSKVYFYTGEAMAYQLMSAKTLYNNNRRIVDDNPAKVLAFLPFHHIFGLMNLLWYTLFGKTMVYLKDRAPSTIQDTCRKHKVTHILTVPLLLNNMASGINRKLNKGKRRQKAAFTIMCRISLLSQLLLPGPGIDAVAKTLFRKVQKNLLGDDIRMIICGGGRVLPETLSLLSAIGYYTTCGFGMTEAGVTSVETDKGLVLRLGSSLGRPLDSVEYSIAPTETEGMDGGELLLKSAYLHSGKLEKGKKVPPATNGEGWLRTGDRASIYGGRLWLDGRLKDMIVNESGENVYPDELEDHFSKLDGADNLCILGVRNRQGYEDITMVVHGSKLNTDDNAISRLAADVLGMNRLLPIYKRISMVLVSDEALPTAGGIKVKRQRLKSMIEDGSLSCSRLDLAGARLQAIQGGILGKTVNDMADGLGYGWRIQQFKSGLNRNVLRLAAGFSLMPEIRLPVEVRFPRGFKRK